MLELVVYTHVGLVRSANEDDFLLLSGHTSLTRRQGDALTWNVPVDGSVQGVFDGMGGMEAGDVASGIAAGALADYLRSSRPDFDSPVAFWNRAIGHANASIVREADRRGKAGQMGCTATVLATSPARMVVAHVGDSRAYLYRDGRLVRISEDQSLVQELVNSGELTEEEAERHPQRSVILQALGVQPTITPQICSWAPATGDLLLICSDGLSSLVGDAVLQSILAGSQDLAGTGQRLIDEAIRRGGTDNVTIVLARVPTVPAAEPTGAIQTLQAFRTEKNTRKRSGARALTVFTAVAALVLVAVIALLPRYPEATEPIGPTARDLAWRDLQDRAVNLATEGEEVLLTAAMVPDSALRSARPWITHLDSFQASAVTDSLVDGQRHLLSGERALAAHRVAVDSALSVLYAPPDADSLTVADTTGITLSPTDAPVNPVPDSLEASLQ
ncbi:MAG: serine/threonine-protein phosphatase [Rhodothermales bacterium]|nr:serine/threonine-protein phosphatase [Rhodothermales bacterium]MBO6781004.1 serine/threonine-protein phosphatase [Rhodothermales bacterium]